MAQELATPLSVTLDIAATLSALIWPIVVIVVLFMLRNQLPALIRHLAARVTKIDLAGITLEFAKAKALETVFAGPGVAFDLRHRATAMQVNDSTAATFLSQLRDPATGDYAIVYLGGGREWLTSRLYIMAVVFARMKGVKSFVFLAENSPDRKFVGWAETNGIRWALARHYPWLEAAYAGASAAIVGGGGADGGAVVVADSGRLGYTFDPQNPQPGISLMRAFLSAIQWPPAALAPHVIAGQPPPAAPAPNDPQWVLIDEATQTSEHAAWVSSSLLEIVLGQQLHSSYVRLDSLQSRNRDQQVRLILAQTGRFVPVVRQDLRFEYLVDRAALLEQLANAAAAAEKDE